jgi:hypothetical protein
MADKDLRTLLEGLHDELQRTESLDADIRDLLERSGDEGIPTDESILQRVQSATDHFEVTHPTITMTLSEIMTILSNAGI